MLPLLYILANFRIPLALYLNGLAKPILPAIGAGVFRLSFSICFVLIAAIFGVAHLKAQRARIFRRFEILAMKCLEPVSKVTKCIDLVFRNGRLKQSEKNLICASIVRTELKS
jgi:hypothetical protein